MKKNGDTPNFVKNWVEYRVSEKKVWGLIEKAKEQGIDYYFQYHQGKGILGGNKTKVKLWTRTPIR